MNNKSENKDILILLGLFVLSVISVYYLPTYLNKLFFLLLLPLVYISKKDYLWFTYFIIIMSCPMRLFEDFGGSVVHRIPEYDIIGKYGVTFLELFLIVFFIKAFIKGRNNKLILNNFYKIFLFLLLFLILASFNYGIEFKSFITYVRQFLLITLFYSFPRLIRNEDFVFMFKILSIFTILALLNQILSATIGFNVADRIAGKHWVELFFENTEYIRAYDATFSQFFTFIFGFVLLTMNRPPINKKFLIFIISISYLSIFMTGTRGWIISSSIVVLCYLFFIERQKSKAFLSIITALMVLMVFVTFTPKLQLLLQSNIERLSTVPGITKVYLFEDDILIRSAQRLPLRLTQRLPKVVEGIKKNPIFGWGFSKTYAIYYDNHVGFANQLLQSGIIGLIILIVFLVNFWLINIRINKKLSYNNRFKNSLLALNLGIISLIVIHFTSTQTFGFSIQRTMLILVFTYFLLADLWQRWALKENKLETNRKLMKL